MVPILRVKNFAAAMEYYVGKLGFQKKWDWGMPPTFGCVTRGKVNLFFVRRGAGAAGDVDVDFFGGCGRVA